MLDLRSEAYVGLGPIPASVPSVYLRVVTETEAGTTRALNHFNKHAGGAVRSLAEHRPRVLRSRDCDDGRMPRAWAPAATVVAGELDLVV